jgi:argininosuccinate synthase
MKVPNGPNRNYTSAFLYCLVYRESISKDLVRFSIFAQLSFQVQILNCMVLKLTVMFCAVLVQVLARKSPVALYNQSLVSMDQQGDFKPEDATGFINIHAIRLREFQRFRAHLEGSQL